MGRKLHIDGTQEFGYSTVKRYRYSYYFFANTVKRVRNLCRNYASVKFIEGYVALFCEIRCKSFDTFIQVVCEQRDYVAANCILRMLGDSTSVFHLIYMEPDENLRLLRHCLYVLDGCERNMMVLPEGDFNKESLSEEELEYVNKQLQLNRDFRKQMMRDVQEMLDESPLKAKDEKAFNKIVEDRNWKFKDFKYTSEAKYNQYKWRDLYDRIGKCEYIDNLSFISQYAHGLSMSNLKVDLNEDNRDGIIGEAVGLLDRMNEYLLGLFNNARPYILEGLLEPETRDNLLDCFDDQHRPDIPTWELEVRKKQFDFHIEQLSDGNQRKEL